MLTVLAAVLPPFGAIVAGAGLARWRGLGDAAVGVLNAYVVWLALPALLFGFVAGAGRATLAGTVLSLSTVSVLAGWIR